MFMSVKFDDGTLMRVLRFKTREELESYKKELELEYRLKLVGTKKDSEGFIFLASKKRKPIWKNGALNSTKESGRERDTIEFGKVHLNVDKTALLNYDGAVKIDNGGGKKYIWE